jgi:hypothetical protein
MAKTDFHRRKGVTEFHRKGVAMRMRVIAAFATPRSQQDLLSQKTRLFSLILPVPAFCCRSLCVFGGIAVLQKAAALPAGKLRCGPVGAKPHY